MFMWRNKKNISNFGLKSILLRVKHFNTCPQCIFSWINKKTLSDTPLSYVSLIHPVSFCLAWRSSQSSGGTGSKTVTTVGEDME